MPMSFRPLPMLAAALLCLGVVLAARPASAQAPSPRNAAVTRSEGQTGPAAVPADLDRRNAEEIRNDFREVLRRYPPALGEVLKLDPSLMSNPAYLQTYPAVAAFVTAHPEVSRYPGYFLESVRTAEDQMGYQPPTAEMQEYNLAQDVLTGLAVGSLIGGIAFVLTWLVRHLLAHRRWVRATRMQMDVHNRLLERLSSATDVQEYLQSAATMKLFADVPGLAGSAQASVPLGRILLSIQIGAILLAGGLGLLIGKGYVPVADTALTLPAVLAIAIGVGFVLAAGASYILSKRLGLLEALPARATGPDRA
jgi:ABC-type multidrug transport system fused ATPase/permease subunit